MLRENVAEVSVDEIDYQVALYDGGSVDTTSSFRVVFPGSTPGLTPEEFLALADDFAQTVRAEIDVNWTAGAVKLFRSFIPVLGVPIDTEELIP